MKVSNLIEAQNLSFTYPDGTNALTGINLQVKKGEFIGILGANGSGKTTLLKLLNGLLKPIKGNVLLSQKDIRSIDKDALFRRVCTCFQNPDHQLFAPTVAQDIAFGPINMGLPQEEIEERVNNSLSAVGMSGCGNRPISALSFGQKKRICLAGVLAMRPEVILLDEPTSSLDPHGVNDIMRLLKDLNKSKEVTLVMSTHSVDLVPLFIDRLIVLNKGTMVREGSPKEVFLDAEMIKLAKLRLPLIGELFDIMKKEDGLYVDGLPLTIAEARAELKELLSL